MATVKLTNVSNPAAFGVEWTNGESGNRFQLVNSRGTVSLDFGMLAPGRPSWSMTRVVSPERFGMDKAPRTFAEFQTIARAYIDG